MSDLAGNPEDRFSHNMADTSNSCCSSFNPFMTNGLCHYYHLEESTFIFTGIRSDF